MHKQAAQKQARLDAAKGKTSPKNERQAKLAIVRKDAAGAVVKSAAQPTTVEKPKAEKPDAKRPAAQGQPVKAAKTKVEKPIKVVAPKPAKVIANTIRMQAYANQTGVIVTGRTTQELLDKADQFQAAYEQKPDILLGGEVLVAGVPHAISGFAPATHVQGDTWHLYYDAVDVTPLGVIWQSAKIAVSRPGVLDQYHGKLNTKTDQKGN